MRRILYLVTFFLLTSNCFADNTILRNASNLRSGTVPNARLDLSSVTFQGQLDSGLANLRIGSFTATSMVTSTTGFSGPGSNLTSLTAANISGGSLGSSVMTSSVAGSAVSSVTIANESISGEDIAKGAIRGPNLSADLILSSHVAANTLGTADIQTSIFISSGTGTVDSIHLKDTAVTPGTYGSDSLSAQITIDADGRITSAGNAAISGTGASSTSSIIYGLHITTVASDTNSFRVRAREIDIGGCYYVNFDTIVALNVAGPGGLDTGSELASTWYQFNPISNSACSSAGIVLSSFSSTSFPATQPGYTKRRSPIATVFNDSSSNIRPFTKRGNLVFYLNPPIAVNNVDPGTAFTQVDMSNYISSSAYSVILQAQMSTTAGGDQSTFTDLRMANGQLLTATGNGVVGSYGVGADSVSFLGYVSSLSLPVIGPRILEYRDSGYTVRLDLIVIGYAEEL